MNLNQLSTPSLLVDLARVVSNCEVMRAKADASGIIFRPHVKTHKTVELALLQHGGRVGPVTVSTLAEAEMLADAGFEDITYAVPVSAAKLPRCASLARRVRQINLLIDHPLALREIEEFSRSEGAVFDLFVKIDCGYHRAGIDPEDSASLDFVRAAAASPAIRLHGLLAHAGHSYNAGSREEILAIASAEAVVMNSFRTRLGGANGSLMRSVGSTPTASVAARFDDCDEVRPGNYVFYDAFQARLGSCTADEVAVSVLATVIGNYPEQRRLLIDAGALAMSKDRGADHLDAEVSFGVVCDLDLKPLPLRLVSLSQEHGKVSAAAGASVAGYPVGTRLRIVPNHSCLTAALFDRYQVIEGQQVINEWKPVRGW